MIGLISAVPEEGRLITDSLEPEPLLAGRAFRRGRISGHEVVYVVSGMGKANAANAATLLIERFRPDLIILFGVGGAYPSSGLRPGDIAIAEKEIYGDEGVLTSKGFRDTRFIGIPVLRTGRKKYFNEFPMDRKLSRFITKMLKVEGRTVVASGPFVTVSACTGTGKRAAELEDRHRAVCEDMEGAAVAQICALYSIPMAEVRGISNIVEKRDRSKWDVSLAARNCEEAVLRILKCLPPAPTSQKRRSR